MDYQRTSRVLNPDDFARANTHLYASFAGTAPSRNVNGILLAPSIMWWDEDRIEATVTRSFVQSKLRPDEQQRLDESPGFADGLTDDTYLEWIEQKAKRIFLILVDLGVPDQIFGVIDDCWDDDDLPISLDQVARLRLTYDKDEKVERKFFNRQFNYLVKNIQKGDHISYDDDEIVPLEMAEKRPVGTVAGLTQSNIDKVHLPRRPDEVFLRRRIQLGESEGRMPQEDFLSAVESMKVIEYDHMTSLWASYIHEGCGYLLLTPVNDSNLKSFLAITPQSFKFLAKQDRRVLLLNWMHCLASAISYLHSKGLAHRNIKPSNIMLDIDNQIFLSDSGIFPGSTLAGDKRGFDKESYDYSAPELAHRQPISLPTHTTLRPSTTRAQAAPVKSMRTSPRPVSASFSDTTSIHTTSTGSTVCIYPTRSNRNSGSKLYNPQKCDIYSLGAIFLEIITVLLKRAPRNFSSHRSSKNKTPGRGGGLPDSSFHKNRGQVESWVQILLKDASKKEDKIFRGVNHILSLVQRMVNPDPEERPTASEVQDRMYAILTDICGLVAGDGVKDGGRGKVHCVGHKQEENVGHTQEESDWDFGFEQLRHASQEAAAALCAAVRAPPSPPPSPPHSPTLADDPFIIYGTAIRGSIDETVSGEEEGDRLSIGTKASNKSSDVKTGGGSLNGRSKIRAKVKPWQAPVYAELTFG